MQRPPVTPRLRNVSRLLLALGVVEAIVLLVLGELAVDDAAGGISTVILALLWLYWPVPLGWSLVRGARERTNVVIGLTMQALALLWTPLCILLFVIAPPDGQNALIFVFVPLYLTIAAAAIGLVVAGAVRLRRCLQRTS